MTRRQKSIPVRQTYSNKSFSSLTEIVNGLYLWNDNSIILMALTLLHILSITDLFNRQCRPTEICSFDCCLALPCLVGREYRVSVSLCNIFFWNTANTHCHQRQYRREELTLRTLTLCFSSTTFSESTISRHSTRWLHLQTNSTDVDESVDTNRLHNCIKSDTLQYLL